MDESTRREFDAWQARLELTVADKIRGTEDRMDAKFRALESRVHLMQQIAGVLGALALIFGAGGTWGLRLLGSAQQELNTLQSDVTSLSAQARAWQALKDSYTKELQNVKEKELATLRIKAGEVVASLNVSIGTNLREQLKGVVFDEIKARHLRIVNATGENAVELVSGDTGGVVNTYSFGTREATGSLGTSITGNAAVWLKNKNGVDLLVGATEGAGGNWSAFSASTGKKISGIGASPQGHGGVWLSNRDGVTVLAADSSGSGGNWLAYSAESAKKISSIGASAKGNGGVWLSNNDGVTVLAADSSGSGGNWSAFSASTGKKISDIGASPQGDGGVWLSNKDGTELLKGLAAGTGGNWYTYSSLGSTTGRLPP
jgi:hypothetical protein